jgi:phosphatidylglycerol:prolipoprotein diacylglycerol transferase
MHPILLKIGNISLYTYGLFVALGFLTALWFARREAKRLNVNPTYVMDLGFYLLIAAIVGSRVFFLAVNPDVLSESIWAVFQIWKGGLVFYGGFIAALITAIVYVRIIKVPFFKIADIFSPGLAAGHAVGRIGCFFAGCCYGKTCDLPWAVVFKDSLSLAPIGVHLHPTQLYSVAGNLLIFLFLWFYRKRTKCLGQLFWIYMLLYGIVRAFIELFRGDDERGFLLDGISVSQGICFVLAVSAVVMLVRMRKQR